MWTCQGCASVNPVKKRTCQSCGKRQTNDGVDKPASLPWLNGTRPCTDVENTAALAILRALVARQMTLAEADAHLATIFARRR